MAAIDPEQVRIRDGAGQGSWLIGATTRSNSVTMTAVGTSICRNHSRPSKVVNAAPAWSSAAMLLPWSSPAAHDP